MKIETPRLRLRRYRAGDLEDFFAILSDPEAMRYWSTEPHADRKVTSDWLAKKLTMPAPTDLVIEVGCRAMGTAGGRELPEVGYLLHPSLWGLGYAGEAMRALIPVLFARPGVDHLTADIDPENLASARLLERLGFQVSGQAARTFCIAGVWSDSTYYRLDRPG